MDKKFMKAAKEISIKLRAIEAEHRDVALSAFPVLEQFDPETAKLALGTFNDRYQAAMWFSGRVRSLGGMTPWDRVALGGVMSVRSVLSAISHGDPV